MSDGSNTNRARRKFFVQSKVPDTSIWVDVFCGRLFDCIELCETYSEPTRILSNSGAVIEEFRAHEARLRTEEEREELRVSIEHARILAEICDDNDVGSLLDAAMAAFYRPKEPHLSRVIDIADELDIRMILSVEEIDPGKYVAPVQRSVGVLFTGLCALVRRTGDERTAAIVRAVNALASIAANGSDEDFRRMEEWSRKTFARSLQRSAIPVHPRDKKSVSTYMLEVAEEALDENDGLAEPLASEGHGWLDILVAEAQRVRPDLSRGYAEQERAFRRLQAQVRDTPSRFDHDPEALVRATMRAIGMNERDVQSLFDANRKAFDKRYKV